MNRDTQLRIADLIARGAVLCLHQTGMSLLLGASEWIPGRGLLVAELGALNQGHVHLVAATHAVSDSDTVSLYAGDSHVASILAAEAAALRRVDLAAWRLHLESESWRTFWAAEREQAKDAPFTLAGDIGAILFRIDFPTGRSVTAEVVPVGKQGNIRATYYGFRRRVDKRLRASPAPEVEAFMRSLVEQHGGELSVQYVRLSDRERSKHS